MQETPLKSKRKGWFSELRHGSWEDALQEKEAVQLTPLQQGAKTTANALAVAECLEGPCIQNIHPCFTKQNPSLSRVPDEGHEERWWHPDSWVVLLWQKRSRVLEGEGALYQSSWLLVVFLVIKALICLLSLIRHQLPCHGTIKRTSLSTGSEVGLFHQWYQWMWGEESRKVHEGNQIFPSGWSIDWRSWDMPWSEVTQVHGYGGGVGCIGLLLAQYQRLGLFHHRKPNGAQGQSKSKKLRRTASWTSGLSHIKSTKLGGFASAALANVIHYFSPVSIQKLSRANLQPGRGQPCHPSTCHWDLKTRRAAECFWKSVNFVWLSFGAGPPLGQRS